MPSWRHEEVLPPGRREEPLQPYVLRRDAVLLGEVHRSLTAPHRPEEIRRRDEDAEVQLRLLRAVRNVERVEARAVRADVDRRGVGRPAGALHGGRVADVALAVE